MINRIAIQVLLALFFIVSTNSLYAGNDSESSVVQSECSKHVNFAANSVLPGFLSYFEQCVPYRPILDQESLGRLSHLLSGGYHHDLFAESFSDCQASSECDVSEKSKEIEARLQHQQRSTGMVSQIGNIAPNANDVLLQQVRTPKFFDVQPHAEKIHSANEHTYIVEIAVPPTLYEREELDMMESVHLRGWYIQGKGIETDYDTVNPLVIMMAGTNMEITAIHHPDDPLYKQSEEGELLKIPYPYKMASKTEVWGARQWRQYAYEFFRQGFDVLMLDRRGTGISGGIVSEDIHEMSEDLSRILLALESGNGLRFLSPDGVLVREPFGGGELIRQKNSEQVPVFLLAASDATSIAALSLHKQESSFCQPWLNDHSCSNPDDYNINIQGAILLSDTLSQLVFQEPFNDAVLEEAILREKFKTMTQPSSEIFEALDRWAPVFLGRGLWDEITPPQAAFELYSQLPQGKELVFVRGPHGETQWGKKNVNDMSRRITSFAKNILKGRASKSLEYDSFREAVLASPPFWEPSSDEGTFTIP